MDCSFSALFQYWNVLLRNRLCSKTTMKILVIKDEKLLADSIQTLLSNKGFEVEVAYDGETGEEYTELGIYYLLILELKH